MRTSGSRGLGSFGLFVGLLFLGPSLGLFVAGCDTGATQGARGTPIAPSAGASATNPVRATGAGAGPATSGGAPVASWRDHTLTWDDLRPAMTELAGVTVLRDAFLDQRIAQALAARSITITDADVAAERAYLIASLDPNPNTAERLLAEIRDRQGLGPVRFEALLRRNASLRRLVANDVVVTEDALARHHDVLHGEKRVCRLIAVASLAEADQVKRELDAGASIADVAVRRSTDASAARGGLLAPIARGDPTWPEAFRVAIFSLNVGETSLPTLVENSYVIVRLEEIRPGDGVTIAAARRETEESLRRSLERVLMENLARSYLGEVKPQIFDSGFDRAWRAAE